MEDEPSTVDVGEANAQSAETAESAPASTPTAAPAPASGSAPEEEELPDLNSYTEADKLRIARIQSKTRLFNKKNRDSSASSPAETPKAATHSSSEAGSPLGKQAASADAFGPDSPTQSFPADAVDMAVRSSPLDDETKPDDEPNDATRVPDSTASGGVADAITAARSADLAASEA
eukprot:scaffold388287_cov24-Prasinocladus_malaysianus.AAC.1